MTLSDNGLIQGTDGKMRCWWCGDNPLYMDYHDYEWGKPVTDDRLLFEKICLEGFQAGLSWLTILKKRENFRDTFHGFDYKKIMNFNEKDVERLLQNKGIIRHRGKIEATLNNAHCIDTLIEREGSFYEHIKQFKPSLRKTVEIPALTESSIALSKDLKQRGFKFVGPTTLYAFMQAMGLVNDHVQGCDFICCD